MTGGVFVASGDVDGDGQADIVTGVGSGGGPHVKVFDGASGSTLRSFLGYAPSFTGGVRVAAGDVNHDGFADLVTGAGPGAPPHVKAFSGATGAQLRSFLAFDASFTSGVFPAAATFTGARLRSRTLHLTARGDVVLPVLCPVRTLRACRGKVALLLPAVQRARVTRKPAVLGRARFQAAPGKRARVAVHISRTGRRALRARRTLKATARLTTRDGGGNVSTKRISIVLERARR